MKNIAFEESLRFLKVLKKDIKRLKKGLKGTSSMITI
jgi:hypothetical protein